MKLFTKEIEAKLRRNHALQKPVQGTDGELDFKPVVKLFTPDAQMTWLITELYDDGDTMFALCDIGMDCVEMGYVSLSELKTLRGRLGLPIERDRFWKAEKTMSEYAKEYGDKGRIG